MLGAVPNRTKLRTDHPANIFDNKALEHALMRQDTAINASPKLVRETLAAACDRAISMTRKYLCGTIVPDEGFDRSRGRSRSLIGLLYYRQT